ncbi:MAG: NAD(P)-binding protein, partial [Nitrosopumilaceae archaeon]
MKSVTILILGGGFGGLSAANELRQNLPSDVKITIIDKKDYFMMDLVKLW